MQGEKEIRKMRGRKGWTSREDQVLRLLREDRGELKWSTIARLMQQQFSIVGKTGKQCRQRYQNHLKSSISTSSWTAEEDKDVLKLHDLYGNKWSIIAQQLPGRFKFKDKGHKTALKIIFTRNFGKSLENQIGLALNLAQNHFCLYQKPQYQKQLQQLRLALSLTKKQVNNGCVFAAVPFFYYLDLIGRLYNFESRPSYKGSFIGQQQKAEEISRDIIYFQQNFKKKKISKKDKCQIDYRSRPFPSKSRESEKKSLRRGINNKDLVQITSNSQNVEKDNSQTVFLLPQGKAHEEQYIFLPYLEKLSENNASRARRLLQVGVEHMKQNKGSTYENLSDLDQNQNSWNCRSKLHMLQSSEEYEYELPLPI